MSQPTTSCAFAFSQPQRLFQKQSSISTRLSTRARLMNIFAIMGIVKQRFLIFFVNVAIATSSIMGRMYSTTIGILCFLRMPSLEMHGFLP